MNREADQTGNIKGAAFRESLRWAEDTSGRDAVVRLAFRMPQEFHALMRAERPLLGIAADAWYPVRFVHALTDALTVDLTPEARHARARQSARASVDRMLGGVHRILFRLGATPALFAREAQNLWDQTQDSGVMRVTVERHAPDGATERLAWTSPVPVCVQHRRIGEAVQADGLQECARDDDIVRLEWRRCVRLHPGVGMT